MKSNINLALGKKQPQKNPVEIKVGYYIFAGVFAIAIVVVAILFASQIQYSLLQDQERDALTALNNQADKKLKMVIVSERLDAIKNVLTARGKLDQKINAITQIVPDAISINTITADEEKVTMLLETGDLLTLNNYLENDLPVALKSFPLPIENVTINNIISAYNLYHTSITFTFVNTQGT